MITCCPRQPDTLKRLFDICLSSIALILLSPFYLALSGLVRLTSPGDILQCHERIGRGGHPFCCYKFRTTYTDAEARLRELFENQPLLHEEWLQTQKLPDDPRITPIGRFLRKTSLEHLPQFWNVLKGDMSIFGPIPMKREQMFCDLQGPLASRILSVRPGMLDLKKREWRVIKD